MRVQAFAVEPSLELVEMPVSRLEVFVSARVADPSGGRDDHELPVVAFLMRKVTVLGGPVFAVLMDDRLSGHIDTVGALDDGVMPATFERPTVGGVMVMADEADRPLVLACARHHGRLSAAAYLDGRAPIRSACRNPDPAGGKMDRVSFLFPLGVRLTTWLVILAFCLIAAWRSDRRPLIGLVAWLAGFETAYQVAAFLLHPPAQLQLVAPVSLSLIVGMPLITVAMTWLGARPNLPPLAAALLVFCVWLAAGFHVNTGTSIDNISGEALNDASKTLWALAYLLPLRAREPQTRPAYTSAHGW